MEVALEGRGAAGMEQVGKGLHPGCGVSSASYLLIYLFSEGSWEGWPQGLGGRGGRAEREEGRGAGSGRNGSGEPAGIGGRAQGSAGPRQRGR